MLLLLAPACGSAADFAHGRPKIDKVSAPSQSSQDPYTLLFTVTFTDTDGDLGMKGTLHLLVDDLENSTRPLSELFAAQSPSLDQAATQGDIDLPVQLDANSLTDGQKVKIGFYLVDAAGLKSNVPYVVLQVMISGGSS
jgi:hypothetical protein